MSNLVLKSIDRTKVFQVTEAVVVWEDNSEKSISLPSVKYLEPHPEIHITEEKADEFFMLSEMNASKDGYQIINEFRARSLPLARWFADAVLDHDQVQLGDLADKYAPIARNLRGPALAVAFLHDGMEGLLFFGATS